MGLSRDLARPPVELLKSVTADGLQIASRGSDLFRVPVSGRLPWLYSAHANLSFDAYSQCAPWPRRLALASGLLRCLPTLANANAAPNSSPTPTLQLNALDRWCKTLDVANKNHVTPTVEDKERSARALGHKRQAHAGEVARAHAACT
eukprot:7466495-Pyramimonas_sp.AAC.1